MIELDFPLLKVIEEEAFLNCWKLRDVHFENVHRMFLNSFNGCNLNLLQLPKLEKIKRWQSLFKFIDTDIDGPEYYNHQAP